MQKYLSFEKKNNKKVKIKFETIQNIVIEKGIIWSNLKIESLNKTIKFGGLKNADSQELGRILEVKIAHSLAISLEPHFDVVQILYDKFNTYLNIDFYISS
jgi:hypothetical protein